MGAEAAMLDVTDFTANPAAPELGVFGVLHVRFGKAMRGSPPRRRAVATVMPWAAEALEQCARSFKMRMSASFAVRMCGREKAPSAGCRRGRGVRGGVVVVSLP